MLLSLKSDSVKASILNRPRKREAVKRMHIKTFVCRVKEAIASVHTILRIAHLDIRLENICWRKTGSLMSFCVGNDLSNKFFFRKRRRKAVLIDFERWQPVSKTARVFTCQYQRSIMYEGLLLNPLFKNCLKVSVCICPFYGI